MPSDHLSARTNRIVTRSSGSFATMTGELGSSAAQLFVMSPGEKNIACECQTLSRLTRISYIVGIYKALHILLLDEQADRWMTQRNDNLLFGGQAPVDYAIRTGIPGLQQIRSLLGAVRGG